MVTVVIFGFNVLVTLMCCLAIGLLFLGASQDGEYSRRIKGGRIRRIDINPRAEEMSLVPSYTDRIADQGIT